MDRAARSACGSGQTGPRRGAVSGAVTGTVFGAAA